VAELTDGRDSAMPDRAIPARVQLLAVAWLRWRVFINGFNRATKKRGVAGLVFVIVLRIVVWTFLAFWIVGPVIGCGFLAWMSIDRHRPELLSLLLAGVFLFWQFISVNGISIAATISSFDPASLLRFPIPFGRYLVLRLLLGLLTPSTIIGCLALFSAVIGIGVADPSLALPALVVLAVYAWMNILFTRMLSAWMDRWLATRRAREIFGVVTLLFFVGIQMFNLQQRNLGHGRGVQGSRLLGVLHASGPFLRWLPSGFAANAILLKGHLFEALAQFAALITCTALFLAIFAIRLHKQFLGEYLSEGAARATPKVSLSVQRSSRASLPVAREPVRGIFSPVIAACLRKEWIYLRGNPRALVGIVTPLIFVFILSRGMFAQHPGYLLPGALAYILLGPLGTLYNVFGADAEGVQLYLLAPVRLRDVVLAKNIASLSMILVYVLLGWIIVLLVSRTTISLSMQISTALWLVFVVGTNLTVGTLRSIQAPRRFVPGQTPTARTPTNRTSGLLVLVILFCSILLQIPVTYLSRHYGYPWLAVLIFGPLAVAAIAAYAVLLRRADGLVNRYRDTLAEELCRA
jgi:ABC-2 type transport system permease protein